MKRFPLVPVIGVACLFAGCGTTNMVIPNASDSSDPDPVEIHGRLTGGGFESSHGVQVLGSMDKGPLTLLTKSGQLEITSTATDNESGIKTFEIISNDRHCRLVNGAWRTTGPEPTKTRDSRTITPDSNGKVPTTVVALANIQVSAELGTFDKVTWQFFGVVTNFAHPNTFVNIGPISYTAVSANVPDANKLDACP